METVGELVVAFIVMVLIGTGLYYALDYSLHDFHNASLAAAVGASSAAPVTVHTPVIAVHATTTPLIADPQVFDKVGTIVYYIQQSVEVPYLVYTQNGQTYSKALEFNGESICVTSVQGPCPGSINRLKSAYGSGPVEVQGIPDQESLLVTRMSNATL